MSIELLVDPERGQVALYNSRSGFAFGPVFGSAEDADDFLEIVEYDGRDPRTMTVRELEDFKQMSDRVSRANNRRRAVS